MMIFSVQDNMANKFGKPFFIDSEDEAKRLFKITVNDPRNELIYNNPEDYSLWLIGSFNERTGVITGEGATKLVDARAVKKEA